MLATIDAELVTLWDTKSWLPRNTIKLPRKPSTLPADYWSLAFSPDAKILALGDVMSIHLWDTTTADHLATLKGHREEVKFIAFSPDGKTLATADYSELIVKLWNVATCEELTTLTGTSGVMSLAFAPDGSLAVGYADNSVHLWRVEQHSTREQRR